MNKNVEDYKKAVDKIEASEKLKEATFHKVQNTKKVSRINLKQFIAACATFVLVVSAGAVIYNNKDTIKDTVNGDKIIAEAEEELPRFKDIDELKKALSKDSYSGAINSASIMSAQEKSFASDVIAEGATSSTTMPTSASTERYSTTNTQVAGVDEADIVKTDGNYIYYVTSRRVLIVDAKNLDLVADIKVGEDEDYYYSGSIQEIFINGDKVILLGNSIKEEIEEEEPDEGGIVFESTNTTAVDLKKRRDYNKTYSMAVAKVYDISKKSSPKLIREVGVEGYYNSARMIDDNIYLIGSKYVYYYKNSEIEDEELLPRVLDTAKEAAPRRIQVSDIAYIEDTKSHSYLEVAGFNLNSNKAASIETVFGASDEVYASQNNMYVVDSVYNYGRFFNSNTTHIFKFKLKDGRIKLVAKGEVSGYVHDQFSMDEYNGYLRIATTGTNLLGDDTNRLFVLDDRLNKVGELTGIAVGEQIKSVRFVGKIGYIVTYEQIDPLFVVDLSDPTNPKMRGELEIPGYSAYLHPYDETHIIGIGYNTKTNQYGSTTTTSLKMSMFDVSDLDHPKELFSTNIGTGSSYSEITYNHKALFYYKEKNLIGFPLTTYSSGSSTGFVLYTIDLKNNEFKKYGELKNESKYWNNVRRIIYIGDDIFSLTNTDITKYDLTSGEKKDTLKIDDTYTPVKYYDYDLDVEE